jgi:uncharacterized protein
LTNSGESLFKEHISRLIERIKRKGSILVAFSGGTDSGVVAALAYMALPRRSLAVTISSPLHPSSDVDEARRTAELIGISHLVVELNELDIPGFTTNPPNRCYLCKSYRFRSLKEIAFERHFAILADGTNTSDLGEFRPGLRAREELHVYSPLLEARLTKEQTRQIANAMGIPVASKPASSCLATRVPYGDELTPARLYRIELAEKWLKSFTGATTIRVREHDSLARIEVGSEERSLFFNEHVLGESARKLNELGYEFVTLDVEGYKSGTFDQRLRNEQRNDN